VQNADIAALWDNDTFNSGFLVIRPSSLTRMLYQMTLQISNTIGLMDQMALNEAIRMMQMHSEGKRALRVKALDKNRFLNGFLYFWKYARKLSEICDGEERTNKSVCPLVVHNNYIIGKQAKIYRFREHLMWQYDGEDQYYTSETRKYLAYTNPKPTTNVTSEVLMESQMSALKTALVVGYLLNRVVILPIFYCDMRIVHRQCHLELVVDVATFDDCFSGGYRENSFLRHPKVPDSVKQGLVNRQFILNADETCDDVLVSRKPVDVMRLFNEVSAKVLYISNLCRIKIDLNDGYFDHEFISKLKNGIKLI